MSIAPTTQHLEWVLLPIITVKIDNKGRQKMYDITKLYSDHEKPEKIFQQVPRKFILIHKYKFLVIYS